MGVLVCECDHKRADHLGGSEYTADKRVLKCQQTNCSCKHYRPDEATRKIKMDLTLRCCFAPLIMILIGIGAFMILSYGFETVLEGYNIEPITQYKTVFANGTLVPDQITVEPSETLLTFFQIGVGFVILFAVYLGSVGYIDSIYGRRYQELMKN